MESNFKGNVLDKYIGETGGNAGVLFLNYEILRQKNFVNSLYLEITTCLHHQPPCDLSDFIPCKENYFLKVWDLAEQDMVIFMT